jgi:hypothetical protein
LDSDGASAWIRCTLSGSLCCILCCSLKRVKISGEVEGPRWGRLRVMSDSPEDDLTLAVRDVSRFVNQGLRVWGQAFALMTRQASSLHRQEVALIRVRGVADRRGLALGLPLVPGAGRPRRTDYADLTVMLAAGMSQAESARRLGVTASAVSMALYRNRELRRRVNRLAHASDF